MSNSTTFANGTVIQPAWLNDVNTAVFLDHVSAKWFGMVPTASAAVQTAALQAAITYCIANQTPLYIPGSATPYSINSGALIFNSSGAGTGLKIVGDSSGNYNSVGFGTVINTTSTSGNMWSSSGGAPIFLYMEGIDWRGNSNTNGLNFTNVWMIQIRNCTFTGFANSSGAAVTVAANGSNSYAGDISFENCKFESNNTSVWFTGDSGLGQINIVRFKDCKFLDGAYHVKNDWGANLPDTHDIAFDNCTFQNPSTYVIYSKGIAQGWSINGGYTEIDGVSFTNNWHRYEGAGNTGISYTKHDFVGSLNAAGQAFVYVINGTGVIFRGNYAANGSATDRFSCDFVTCTSIDGAPAILISGGSPYPIRVNNVVVKNPVNENWLQSLPTGSGNFVGISTGDGWPGGSVCTLNTAQYTKTNGRMYVDVDTQITTKSASGSSVLIGLLPYANDGGAITFPVATTGITGTQPFYATIAGGGNFATLYDATHTAIASSAMSVNATVRCQFNYPTKS